MLTQEEENFVRYWEDQRQRKKEFLKKFSIGMPVISIVCVAFFLNFLSGWYGKADKEIRRHSSLIFVVLIAVIAIVVFMIVFTARHKWDQNESDYQSLLVKQTKEPESKI